jgi:hypothetical protein
MAEESIQERDTHRSPVFIEITQDQRQQIAGSDRR